MRLCLNMIVRDESAILERCLQSVRPHIDCYVVCDTGSTDPTVSLVERVLGGIPGEIHAIPFRDFEQARNEALELCRRSTRDFDYILLLDADMELVVEDDRWREGLRDPAYLVRQVSEGFAYDNVRLVARSLAARYVGATHEYLDLPVQPERLSTIHMKDHACGSSRSVKTERDLALLGAALERKPDDPRTLFYLAQTLREAGRHAEALPLYERRAALGGWEEEVWYSRFMAARCHLALGDEARFVAGCLEAYDLRPSRAEPLHDLARQYRLAGRSEACALLCEAGMRIPLPGDALFVEEDVYRHGFRFEMSISGFYCREPGRRAAGRDLCEELATRRDVPAHVRGTVRGNWRWYARGADDLFGGVRFVALDVPMPPGFRACNPSVAVRDGETWCVVRGVNYRLQDDRYVVLDDETIRTQSQLVQLDADLRPRSAVPIVEEDPALVERPAIVGLEDIRLIWDGARFRGAATVADRHPEWRRQMAVFDLGEEGRVERLTLQEHGAEQHQKNWVPFVDRRGLGFVYWTDPTVVLRWDEAARQARPWRTSTCGAALEHLRGGSGALPFDRGWLYVAHEVGFPAGERVYMHRFVHLDRAFRVRAVTEPFYFRRVGVEFCCGLAAGPGPGQLLASFGVEDGEAWLAVLDEDGVRRRLKRVPRGAS